MGTAWLESRAVLVAVQVIKLGMEQVLLDSDIDDIWLSEVGALTLLRTMLAHQVVYYAGKLVGFSLPLLVVDESVAHGSTTFVLSQKTNYFLIRHSLVSLVDMGLDGDTSLFRFFARRDCQSRSQPLNTLNWSR